MLMIHKEMVLGHFLYENHRKGNTMKKIFKIMTTLFIAMTFAVVGFSAPANAAPWADGGLGVPYPDPNRPAPTVGTATGEDMWVASAQHTGKYGFSATHALGAGDYRVLNMEINAEGVASDLASGTCPGPIRYTDNTIPGQEFIAELGECGGWERFGWLQEDHVVRLSGLVNGNYLVNDVVALGAPGNQKLGFTNTPDVTLMVNNANERDQMYLFGLIDYTNLLPANVT